jgi:D-proline reductase (dithiol) PrdB
MSHISTNFDRTGFLADHNVVFPIDRLKELARAGIVGEVASMHYAFMGASTPTAIERPARQLAGLLKKDQVDAVLLVPV